MFGYYRTISITNLSTTGGLMGFYDDELLQYICVLLSCC